MCETYWIRLDFRLINTLPVSFYRLNNDFPAKFQWKPIDDGEFSTRTKRAHTAIVRVSIVLFTMNMKFDFLHVSAVVVVAHTCWFYV